MQNDSGNINDVVDCSETCTSTTAMVRMSNVGVLPDVEIPLDGLTVVTGNNNTGKSTLLKAIYCMIRPATGFKELKRESAALILRYIATDVLGFNSAKDKNLDELMELVDGIPEERVPRSHRDQLRLIRESISFGLDCELYGETVAHHIEIEFGELDQFQNQTCARKTQVEIDMDGNRYAFGLRRGRIDCEGDTGPFPDVLLYDAPLVMNPSVPSASEDHVSSMYRLIHDPTEFNMFWHGMTRIGKTRFDRMTSEIIGGSILPDCSAYIRRDGVKIDIRNMSSGIKLFSVLRVLSDRGHLRKGSVLLLDEPEIHLHPEYINTLAEIISVMVADVGIRVVMTTCSPQLLMAISSASRKEGIQARFLHLAKHDGGVVCSEVTDDLGPVFSEMAEAFTAADGGFEAH